MVKVISEIDWFWLFRYFSLRVRIHSILEMMSNNIATKGKVFRIRFALLELVLIHHIYWMKLVIRSYLNFNIWFVTGNSFYTQHNTGVSRDIGTTVKFRYWKFYCDWTELRTETVLPDAIKNKNICSNIIYWFFYSNSNHWLISLHDTYWIYQIRSNMSIRFDIDVHPIPKIKSHLSRSKALDNFFYN